MDPLIASRIEHTLSTPFGMGEEIARLCAEARAEQYRAVVVPSSRILEAYEAVEGSSVKVSCLVGFPFGWSDADAKRYEIEVAVDSGAHEIEYVPSLARLKEKKYQEVLRELRDAEEACDERPLKTAIEAHLWTREEAVEIAQIVLDSGARFVSLGIVENFESLALWRELVGPNFGIKCELLAIEDASEAFAAGANLVSPARLGRVPGGAEPMFGI